MGEYGMLLSFVPTLLRYLPLLPCLSLKHRRGTQQGDLQAAYRVFRAKHPTQPPSPKPHLLLSKVPKYLHVES